MSPPIHRTHQASAPALEVIRAPLGAPAGQNEAADRPCSPSNGDAHQQSEPQK